MGQCLSEVAQPRMEEPGTGGRPADTTQLLLGAEGCTLEEEAGHPRQVRVGRGGEPWGPSGEGRQVRAASGV